MLIRIIAVGRVREAFIRDGIAEYARRLRPFARLELIETKEEAFKEGLSAAEKARVLEREGDAILKAVGPGHLIALDIQGRMLSSEELAEHIAQLQLAGESTLQFVIGGSLGLSPQVLDRAQLRLSFSRMTFPHQLFRLILLEQVYRASTILRAVPYHK